MLSGGISARRGPVEQVRSDMGTNLTGADRELREALGGVNSSDLQRAALKHGIDWRFKYVHLGKSGVQCRFSNALMTSHFTRFSVRSRQL